MATLSGVGSCRCRRRCYGGDDPCVCGFLHDSRGGGGLRGHSQISSWTMGVEVQGPGTDVLVNVSQTGGDCRRQMEGEGGSISAPTRENEFGLKHFNKTTAAATENF